MTETLTLLDTQLSDLDKILPLIQDFYQHFGYKYSKADKERTLHELFEHPNKGCLWLIAKEQKIVGYVFLSLYFSLEFGGQTAFIDELFILPGDRGQGLGSKVIGLVEQKCRQLNLRAIHLESEITNERATALYLKSGFVDYNRRLMTKTLV